MTFVLEVLGGVVVLVVAVWVAIFGTAGVALAAFRGKDQFHGFVVGALGGPVGCAWLYYGDRRNELLGRVLDGVGNGVRGPAAARPRDGRAADVDGTLP